MSRQKRWYEVHIAGFKETPLYFVEKPSQAKYQAYKALRECGYGVSLVSIGSVARVRLTDRRPFQHG